MKLHAFLLAMCVACPIAASAADTYRWVDENGRTHYADTVPDKYKKTAVKVDTTSSELSSDQRDEAKSRSAREKAAADARARSAARPVPPAPVASAASAISLGGSAPRVGTPTADDCASLQKAYRASMECFAPFRNVNGSIKAEAYAKCVEVPDPVLRCGITPLN